jgi:hypothetical protein
VPNCLSFEVVITAVSCGDNHSAFLTENALFTIGKNTKGQLGIGDQSIKFSASPILVQLPKDDQDSILLVRCGGSHTAVLT